MERAKEVILTMKKLAVFVLLFCFLIEPIHGAKGNEGLLKTVVYESDTQGYHTYRIPALVATQKGTLLAFCEGRKTGRGDHGDIDLMLRRSSDAGRTWDQQRIVYEEGGTEKMDAGCSAQYRSCSR